MKEREKEKERVMQREKLEIEERIEIEKEKLKFEKEENEREKHFQIRMKEIEMQENTTSKSLPLDTCKMFDVRKLIRLIPPFQEKEVDKYCLHFETVVENLKWPTEHWTLLLQSVVRLTGRTSENI